MNIIDNRQAADVIAAGRVKPLPTKRTPVWVRIRRRDSVKCPVSPGAMMPIRGRNRSSASPSALRRPMPMRSRPADLVLVPERTRDEAEEFLEPATCKPVRMIAQMKVIDPPRGTGTSPASSRNSRASSSKTRVVPAIQIFRTKPRLDLL
jgi:hypothetical protein